MEGTQPRHPPMQLTSQIVQEIDRDYAPFDILPGQR
jgi:hypothetical protein